MLRTIDIDFLTNLVSVNKNNTIDKVRDSNRDKSYINCQKSKKSKNIVKPDFLVKSQLLVDQRSDRVFFPLELG